MVALPRSVEYGDGGGVEPGHEQQRPLAREQKYLDSEAKDPELRPPKALVQVLDSGVASINDRCGGY